MFETHIVTSGMNISYRKLGLVDVWQVVVV